MISTLVGLLTLLTYFKSLCTSYLKMSSSSVSETIECSVCIEPFTGRRKQVKCVCGYMVCTDCSKQYLKSTIKAPHCMNCNVSWNRDFLCNTFTNSFIDKEYKDYRKTILLDREKAQIPQMQEIARSYLDWKKERENKDELIVILERERVKTTQRLALINDKLIRLRSSEFIMPTEDKPKDEKSKLSIACRCPKDGCNGYVYKTDHECKLCSCKVCKNCHVEVNDEEHTCKKEDIDTKKEIEKSTKPCPKCQTRIFKITGCDQMWCTQCNVAFSWRTGELAKGMIHNPHYFQWLRDVDGDQPVRNPGDVHCGGLPHPRTLLNGVKKSGFNSSSLVYTRIRQIYMSIAHIQDVIVTPIRRDLNINQNTPSDILNRVKYMVDELDEKKYTTSLMRKVNIRERNQDMLHLYELYVNIGTEKLNSVVNKVGNIHDHISEMEKLQQYVMIELKKVSANYNMGVYKISDTFNVRLMMTRYNKNGEEKKGSV